MEHFERGLTDGQATGRQEPGSGPSLNYYRVLDVDPAATRLEIREAYLGMKSTYGAGSAALYSLISESEAAEQMAIADEAYRVLNDDVARRNYDRQTGLGRGQPRQGALGSDPADPACLHAERLLFARDLAQGEVSQSADPTTIRTHRSTLPIIKMRASRAGSEDMKGAMAALMEGSDPGDGDLFRRLREACEVSEDEICERTKVCVTYIQAIEANRFERLPQAVYVKGFLRSYFRYLCVPEAEKLVAAFSARLMDWQANRKA